MGPELLESVYTNALLIELKNKELFVQKEVPIPVYYNEERLNIGFRTDIRVNKKVIIEVKSIEAIAAVHRKQVLTYLKLTNCKLGILVNFNVNDIKSGIIRKVNRL